MADDPAPHARILGWPTDSRAGTIAMAVLVSSVSALLVSTAAVLLEPRITANRAAESAARLQEMIDAMPGLGEILSRTGADSLETVVVNLDDGTPAPDIPPGTFDPRSAAENPETSTALPPEADIAGLKRVPLQSEITVLRADGALRLVILPVWGAGYQSTIAAQLALEGDLTTVAGIAVTEQSETPGLGAKIAEPAWAALWPGTKLSDDTGEIRFEVVRGKAQTEYQIDGITGATRTGNAVGNMVRFWLGPDGYGPVLDALRQGAL